MYLHLNLVVAASYHRISHQSLAITYTVPMCQVLWCYLRADLALFRVTDNVNYMWPCPGPSSPSLSDDDDVANDDFSFTSQSRRRPFKSYIRPASAAGDHVQRTDVPGAKSELTYLGCSCGTLLRQRITPALW